MKWTTLGMVVFFLLSLVMTCCFIWQYRIPKLRTGSLPHTHPHRQRRAGTLYWDYFWSQAGLALTA